MYNQKDALKVIITYEELKLFINFAKKICIKNFGYYFDLLFIYFKVSFLFFRLLFGFKTEERRRETQKKSEKGT